MRYIYCEPIITTVTDKEITSDAEMRTLFETLHREQQNVQLSFEDPDNRDFVRNLENARITAIRPDNTIDIHAFFNGASVKYGGIPLLNMKRVRLVAGKQALTSKYRVTRFHHMDVAEIE